MEWGPENSPSKKKNKIKFNIYLSVGKVIYAVFWDGKIVMILKHDQTTNSDPYIMTKQEA